LNRLQAASLAIIQFCGAIPLTLNSLRVGSLYRIAGTAATAGLLFGFDTAVINGALLSLRLYFRLSEVQVEVAASSLLYGCFFGALASGLLSDRYGRRTILRVSGLLFLLSAIFAAVPHTFGEFLTARVLGGLGIGLASTIAPLYLAEVSPREIRGRMITLNQIAIVSGILVAYLTNWALAAFGVSAWRWMFGSGALPALIFVICLSFVPESPRWLLAKGRLLQAEAALSAIGGADARTTRIDELSTCLVEEGPEPGWMWRLRRPLAIAVTIAFLQQVTGINTVLYYGALLFAGAGNSGSDGRAFAANVLLGITNLVFTLVALFIMDRIGRRVLLTGSAALMTVALLMLVFAFRPAHPTFTLIVGSTMLYVAAFAVGLGPGAWVYMAEIFPTNVRGRAMSIATTVLWLSCILVSNSFLSLLHAFGPAKTFACYAGTSAIAVLFFMRLPETRGKSLEAIGRSWTPS